MPARGVALTLFACGLLTGNDALMKSLVAELPLGQAVGLRGLLGFALVAGVAAAGGGLRQLRPQNARRVGILTALLLICLFLFPLSLRFIPLADAVMLAYVSPAVVAALSPWLLGERVGWRRWSAVAIGLVGAALVIDPSGAVQWAVALPLIVAVLIGLRDLMTRRVIEGESTLALVAAANLAAGVLGAATMPFAWAPMTGAQILQLCAAAALVTLSQWMMTAAFRDAEATVLSCLKYSSIAWAAALGWLYWGERLSPADWLGGALIALSGVVITLRSK
ncbi:MAG: DMT family transporter [Pseudomonadota bacterium]